MRLAGKYLYDKLVEAFQGNFGISFSDSGNSVSIELWQLKITIIKNYSAEFFVKSKDTYISFGKVDLH